MKINKLPSGLVCQKTFPLLFWRGFFSHRAIHQCLGIQCFTFDRCRHVWHPLSPTACNTTESCTPPVMLSLLQARLITSVKPVFDLLLKMKLLYHTINKNIQNLLFKMKFDCTRYQAMSYWVVGCHYLKILGFFSQRKCCVCMLQNQEWGFLRMSLTRSFRTKSPSPWPLRTRGRKNSLH